MIGAKIVHRSLISPRPSIANHPVSSHPVETTKCPGRERRVWNLAESKLDRFCKSEFAGSSHRQAGVSSQRWREIGRQPSYTTPQIRLVPSNSLTTTSCRLVDSTTPRCTKNTPLGFLPRAHIRSLFLSLSLSLSLTFSLFSLLRSASDGMPETKGLHTRLY